MAGEALKIYGDRRSQPTRAILLFCKVNGIEFEEVTIVLFSGAAQTHEYQAINPTKKVPAIAHGDFTLFESHAILIYLASTYQVPDHWYPADLRKRAKLHSVLDWHHTNLRLGSVGYLTNTILMSLFGKTPNPERAAESEQTLASSFSTIETVWLKDDAKFLLGNDKPSIADLALVSEIMQFHMLGDEEMNRLIGAYKKVKKWIENVKNATNPHFDQVHQHLFDFIANFKNKA
ncbi:hypothetical protein RND81_08G116600 [Saponaria officinalis]|uniref:glutathione transferase n=1 Tax=Saponaria officinalis TaxID=3572 RepID=A0AAW1J6A8_SAPOF